MNAWLPKQYGAWAMLVAPVITGAIIGGFGWGPVAIAIAWITAYLAYMAVRGAVTGRRKRQHVAPSVVFSVLTVLLLTGLLWWRPSLIWWAIPLAVLLGVSLAMVIAGRERSVINDAALIGASVLMTAITATAGRLGQGVDWITFACAAAWPTAWIASAVLAGYFWGTIPYVKTMIRERGKHGWYIGSVAYHCALIVPAFLINRWIGCFAVIAAARAAVVPKLWPKAKPRQIGIAEVMGTVALIVLLVATLR